MTSDAATGCRLSFEAARRYRAEGKPVNKINTNGNMMSACAVLTACGVVVAATLCVATNAWSQTIVMKLSTATLNDTQHEWMKRFAAAIEKNSNGRIKGEVYPASQLGAIPRQIEGTQLGSIQAWIGPPEFLVGVDTRYELLSAPGVFKGDEQVIKTLADPEFSKAFLALGANKGLVGMTIFPSGPMAFTMRAPMRTLADIKGKKVRVLASPFQMDQLTRLGGTGVPMTLGDVLPAIQQGTLDGAMSSVPVFTALQYYDAAKYITETGQSYIVSMAVFSKRWFDGLPADLQSIVRATAQELKDGINTHYRDFQVQQRKVWVEKGGELLSLSPADHAELIQKMAPVGPDIVKAKPELKPLWDSLLAAAKRNE
jgi:TRAP-type C4-dicarboxylate transport system substrate-binding protein